MDQRSLEPAAAPSAGSFLAFRSRHALQPGTPCYNCGTALLGPWCYACGQAGEDFHRHAIHLAAETFESFFHADGRFWRTLARLVLHPSRLTRDYLAGKRAPQIPPLRLFLAVLLILFLVGGWVMGNARLLDLGPVRGDSQAQLMKNKISLGLSPEWDEAATAWLRAHVGRALQHPDELATAIREQAHDFAFLMLPVSAFILAAIFAFRRGFVLFDHFIFSMHSLSFQGLLISTALAGHHEGVPGAGLLLWAAPVHLFAHMRGTYGTGPAGTLARMAILFVCSVLAFCLLLLALLFAGLQAMRA
jgi:hypothetical protein